MTKEDWR